MSQLPEPLLKQSNMNIMAPIDQNMNIINTVPLPQFIPNNQNLLAALPIKDDNKQKNEADTSN